MISKLIRRQFATVGSLATWGETTYGWGRPINNNFYVPTLVEGLDDVVPVISHVLEFFPVVGKDQVAEDQRYLSDIALEADVNVHYLLSQLSKVAFEAEIQEENVFQLLGVASVKVVVAQVRSEVEDSPIWRRTSWSLNPPCTSFMR